MKHVALLALLLVTCFYTNAQGSNKNYDSVLAKKLNADANGMKRYYLVILKTGTAEITDKAQRDSIFTGHQNNIKRLAEENKLVVAGPFGKNDKAYRGIFILNTASKEEAEKMIGADPVLQTKIMEAEYYPWFGTAALQEIFELHKKLQKNN